MSSGVRTVVVTRPLTGATKDHYTFQPSSVASLNFIAAVGSSETFGYHAAHDGLSLSFSNPTGPTCVCDVGSSGELCEAGGVNCHQFTKNCVARAADLGTKGEDSGDLLVSRMHIRQINDIEMTFSLSLLVFVCSEYVFICLHVCVRLSLFLSLSLSLVQAQKNPTCNSEHYSGGLSCCGHKRIMLDADQPVPDDLLR